MRVLRGLFFISSTIRWVVSQAFFCVTRTHSAILTLYWRSRLSHLGDGSRIYKTVEIYAPRRVSIGRNVVLNDFVHIWGGGGVEIGSNTLVAAHTIITSQTHDVDAVKQNRLYRDTQFNERVSIGSNVWIGSHVTILPGVSIGDDSIIGAGAVVTKSIPSRVLAVGIPARVVRNIA